MGLIEVLLSQLYAAPLFYSLIILLLTAVYLIRMKLTPNGVNPFENDTRQKRRPLTFDKEEKKRVIKQAFVQSKVPQNLDAIVIGSGIGGLSVAAILAKAGKRVLVLEQYGKAGGCTHTFGKKGYEFDIGIHYVGKIQGTSYTRTLLDQISDGQIQWHPLDVNFDTVVLGRGDKQVNVPIRSGEEFRQSLLDSFPDEEKAIDTFIADLKLAERSGLGMVLLKVLPVWLATLLYKTGIIDYLSSYTKYSTLNTQEYINSLTDNHNLRATFAYCYGDYGTSPGDSAVAMNAGLFNHFMKGSGYPIGGASQIAFNIIPVIERGGGKVLCNARVTDIIFENGSAAGVKISRGEKEGKEGVSVYAPIVISDAGVFNTQAMIPPQIFSKSPLSELVASKRVRNGVGALSLFVGLNASAESLGVKALNIWAHANTDLDKTFKDITDKKEVDADNIGDIPLIFLSFPSAKDPTWAERKPDKTTLTAITCVNYDWFQPWAKDPVKKRGADYEELKDAIGKQMWKQIIEMYPQLEGKVEYFNVGTPITNDHYIASNRGEMYGLDHNQSRFEWDATMKLRPDTGIPGLYLTGQDVMTCGFTGALYGGLLSAGAVLGRNLYGDCDALHKQLIKEGRSLNV